MRSEPLEDRPGDRLFSPSAERNSDAVAAALKHILPNEGVVLEVSSGTGQHIVRFAAEMPELTWQPSERDAGCLGSIVQWIAADAPPNIRQPIRLDVMDQLWPIASAAAVVCLNMIHIAPWPATEALMRGANAILRPGGVLALYGPFRRDGQHTAPSNAVFDEDLKSRDSDWGVRNLEDVAACAKANGFGEPQIVEMPANNLLVVLRKRAETQT